MKELKIKNSPELSILGNETFKIKRDSTFTCDDNKSSIYKGQYNNTVLDVENNVIIEKNIVFENLLFCNNDNKIFFSIDEYIPNIIIRQNNIFKNVTFNNCVILLSNIQNTDITDCNFNECIIIFSSNCLLNKITNSRFYKCTFKSLLNSNLFFNVISDCIFSYSSDLSLIINDKSNIINNNAKLG